MSTPLPFIMYSVWGRIFNFNIQTLRIFSVIIAFVTYLLFHKLIFSIFNNSKIAIFATFFIVMHPYMVGLSIFVFTDMLTILFIVLSCVSIRNKNPIILLISLACGLLCRQYFIFFTLAVFIYFFLKLYRGNLQNNNIFLMLLSVFISIMPLVLLVILWKGFSPDNELTNIYLDEAYSYHLSYFTLYICQLFIYLLPMLLISWRSFYTNNKTMLICIILSWFYWLFPVRPCKYHVDANIHTVGFFHRFINYIFGGNQFIEDVVFYIAFLLGLPIIIFVMKDTYDKWMNNNLDFSFLLNLSIITFLMVMPFSYMHWEKYFLPLLPLVAIRILLVKIEVSENAEPNGLHTDAQKP